MDKEKAIHWINHRLKSSTNYTDLDINFIIDYLHMTHKKKLDFHKVVADVRTAAFQMKIDGYINSMIGHVMEHFKINIITLNNKIIKFY